MNNIKHIILHSYKNVGCITASGKLAVTHTKLTPSEMQNNTVSTTGAARAVFS